MSFDCIVVIAVFVCTALFLLSQLLKKLQQQFFENFVCGVQTLVERMKEYDLDTRAGLLICSGKNLRICYIDNTLQQLIGCPQTIEDILMPSMQEKHRQIASRYAIGQELPDSLNHPLRNVEIRIKEGQSMRAKIIISKFAFLPHQIMDHLFYVVIQPFETATSLRRKGSTVIHCSSNDLSVPVIGSFEDASSKANNAFLENTDCTKPSSSSTLGSFRDSSSSFSECADCPGLVEVYGVGAISYLDRGLLPATERYSQATVLAVDIVNFTGHCMVKDLDEINIWMTRIHTCIDLLVEKHAIRKVETKGDGCICVTGTNFTSDEDAPSKDLSSTQASRMLAFGHDLGLALSSIPGTEVRMGLATGPVVLTHISHAGDTLPAKYIWGDTVNVACRMEQTGRVGTVHLSESAALAYAEETRTAPPAMQSRLVKGKGKMRTVFYNYSVGGCFFLPPAEG